MHTIGKPLVQQNMKVKKSVILAAGKGKRMGDLTTDIPKPMLKIGDKPILEHIVEGLISAGISEIFIITGYQAESIENYFGTGSKWDAEFTFGRQEIPNGTGKAPEAARNWVEKSPFLLTYGDILVHPNTYSKMVNRYEKGDTQGIVTITKGDDITKGGIVLFDQDRRFTEVIEKPSHETIVELKKSGRLQDDLAAWYNAGIYVFEPRIFEHTEKLSLSPRGEYELTDAFNQLAASGDHLSVVETEGQWVDVRDPEVLRSLGGA